MSRYIKFDDAVKIMACEMYAEAQSQGYDVDGIEGFMPEAKAWITDAPSIDIVRCKECKFWIGHISDDDGFDEGLDECRWRDSEAPDADGFCSYGEAEGE